MAGFLNGWFKAWSPINGNVGRKMHDSRLDPMCEPGLSELLSSVREKIRFTDEIGEAVPEADLVAVGTPPKVK